MANDTPLVSVLVCNYNYDRYINQTLDSILNQDYKNLEVVIVDDGSSDNSVATIRKYINEHQQLKIILNDKKINEGICYARNDAIDASQGEYILFLDSDDTIPSNYISSMYSVSVENNIDVVYGDMKVFGDETGIVNFPDYDQHNLILYNYLNVTSLVNKSKIGKNRFDIELNRKTLEDYDFWLGLSLSGLKFMKAHNIYLNYRIKKQSRNDNELSIRKKIINFTEVWNYSFTKYRKLYPDLLGNEIIFEEMQYQLGQMKPVEDELSRLNKIVQSELIPELQRREEHINLLDKKNLALQQQYNNLQEKYSGITNTITYRLNSVIKKGIKKVSDVFRK